MRVQEEQSDIRLGTLLVASCSNYENEAEYIELLIW